MDWATLQVTVSHITHKRSCEGLMLAASFAQRLLQSDKADLSLRDILASDLSPPGVLPTLQSL